MKYDTILHMTLSLMKRGQLTIELEQMRAVRLSDLKFEITNTTGAIYRRTIKHFWDLGSYFHEIKKNKLYLNDTDWYSEEEDAFEQWCQVRTGWNGNWISKFISFYKAYDITVLWTLELNDIRKYIDIEKAFVVEEKAKKKMAAKSRKI